MFPLNTNTRWLQSWEETNGSRRNRGFKDKPSKRSHRSVQKPSLTFPICQPLQEAEKYHYFCCQLTKMSFFHNSHCAISNYHECLYWTKHSTQVQACGEQQTQKPEFKTFPWGNFLKVWETNVLQLVSLIQFTSHKLWCQCSCWETQQVSAQDTDSVFNF